MTSGVNSFDLAVIGAGPGGYVAALKAAAKGLSVCVIEEREVGGTCLNRGCIPTKALVGVAERYQSILAADKVGIRVTGATLDPEGVWIFVESVTARLRKGIQSLFDRHGVTLISGRAVLRAPSTLAVTNHAGEVCEYQADKIILATGSRPRVFPGWEIDGEVVLTSDDLLKLRSIPQSLIVIGGGYIGCELAGVFAALGSQVTILEAMPEILPMLDAEITKRLKSFLKRQGITIKTGVMVESVRAEHGRGVIMTADGRYEGDKVLIAVGRVANSSNLGLEAVGVALNQRGEVIVDEQLCTSVPGIYAIGDLADQPYKLAHVASKHAEIVVRHMSGEAVAMDYTAVPSVVFTSPEAAAVGLSEEQARERGLDPIVGLQQFTANGKALAADDNRGLVKVIANREGKLLGVHILGPHASDLLPEAVLALAEGIPIARWAEVIRAHPTLAETTAEALVALLES